MFKKTVQYLRFSSGQNVRSLAETPQTTIREAWEYQSPANRVSGNSAALIFCAWRWRNPLMALTLGLKRCTKTRPTWSNPSVRLMARSWTRVASYRSADAGCNNNSFGARFESRSTKQTESYGQRWRAVKLSPQPIINPLVFSAHPFEIHSLNWVWFSGIPAELDCSRWCPPPGGGHHLEQSRSAGIPSNQTQLNSWISQALWGKNFCIIIGCGNIYMCTFFTLVE